VLAAEIVHDRGALRELEVAVREHGDGAEVQRPGPLALQPREVPVLGDVDSEGR